MIGLVREVLTPFVPGEVAVGDPAGHALPGFEIDVPQHHTRRRAPPTPYPAARVLPSGLKATLLNVALFHGEGLVDKAFARGHVPQHHTAAAAAAVSGGEGLAVGAEGHAPNAALFHGEGVVRQAFACGHVPQHHTADADAVTPYPAARVLPSGLKATLITRPSFTGRGSSTRRLRAATSHSTTPPPPPTRRRIRRRGSCRRG